LLTLEKVNEHKKAEQRKLLEDFDRNLKIHERDQEKSKFFYISYIIFFNFL